MTYCLQPISHWSAIFFILFFFLHFLLFFIVFFFSNSFTVCDFSLTHIIITYMSRVSWQIIDFLKNYLFTYVDLLQHLILIFLPQLLFLHIFFYPCSPISLDRKLIFLQDIIKSMYIIAI